MIMAKKKVNAKKAAQKLNDAIKANTKYAEEPTVVADSPAPRSSNDIIQELIDNE
jgi:hypothetical protein